MKRLVVMLMNIVFAFIFSGNIYAFEISGQPVEVTVTDTYVSRYIWRGQDLYSDNDGAHQPSIDIGFPGLLRGIDVSLNIWGSFPMNSGHEDGEELDYTITFSRDLLDEMFSLSAGYTYFDFPNTASTADVVEPWFSGTLNKIPFLPIDVSASFFAGYDFKAKSGGPDEGWYYSWGFDTELPLPRFSLIQEGQTLALGVVNWGNDGVADLEPSSLYATEFLVLTSYTLGGFSVTPSLHYTINHEEQINNGDEELSGCIELSYYF